jgi:hypothetical protein
MARAPQAGSSDGGAAASTAATAGSAGAAGDLSTLLSRGMGGGRWSGGGEGGRGALSDITTGLNLGVPGGRGTGSTSGGGEDTAKATDGDSGGALDRLDGEAWGAAGGEAAAGRQLPRVNAKAVAVSRLWVGDYAHLESPK